MIYDHLPGLILGYHGCDRTVGDAVLSGKTELNASKNSYDWLGHGRYFWEYNPTRAVEWVRRRQRAQQATKVKAKEPMAIGAVIDLGFCLNLLDARFLAQLPHAYAELRALHADSGQPLPQNRTLGGSKDLLLRHLDCAVIETLHQLRVDERKPAFDTARGVFVEGEPLYPGAAIQKYNHIQVCVRNPDCIKGYFRLREDL